MCVATIIIISAFSVGLYCTSVGVGIVTYAKFLRLYLIQREYFILDVSNCNGCVCFNGRELTRRVYAVIRNT